MKKSLLLILTLALLFACKTNKNVTENKTVKIIRDCTGTYIQLNKKDYKVCNEESIQNIESDTTVDLTFENVVKCEVKEGVAVCMMYHKSDGFVKITNINN